MIKIYFLLDHHFQEEHYGICVQEIIQNANINEIKFEKFKFML